jgi:NAD-dependent SIR2 family protein deacetylase
MQCVNSWCRNNYNEDGERDDIRLTQASEWRMQVSPDTHTIQADQSLPMCPHCGGRARPNVLMFSDGSFDDQREVKQEAAFDEWLEHARKQSKRVAVIEIGAGVVIPTVRRQSEFILRTLGPAHASLLRINPEHSEIGHVTGFSDATTRLLSMTSDSLAILRRLDGLLDAAA